MHSMSCFTQEFYRDKQAWNSTVGAQERIITRTKGCNKTQRRLVASQCGGRVNPNSPASGNPAGKRTSDDDRELHSCGQDETQGERTQTELQQRRESSTGDASAPDADDAGVPPAEEDRQHPGQAEGQRLHHRDGDDAPVGGQDDRKTTEPHDQGEHLEGPVRPEQLSSVEPRLPPSPHQ